MGNLILIYNLVVFGISFHHSNKYIRYQQRDEVICKMLSMEAWDLSLIPRIYVKFKKKENKKT